MWDALGDEQRALAVELGRSQWELVSASSRLEEVMRGLRSDVREVRDGMRAWMARMEMCLPTQGVGGMKQPQPPPSRRLAPRVISWDALEPTEEVKGSGSFGSVRIYRWSERAMRVAVKEMKGDVSGLLSTHDIDALKAEATLQASKRGQRHHTAHQTTFASHAHTPQWRASFHTPFLLYSEVRP